MRILRFVRFLRELGTSHSRRITSRATDRQRRNRTQSRLGRSESLRNPGSARSNATAALLRFEITL